MHLVTKLGLDIFVDGGEPAHLPHKIGGEKKPFLFCPHKNYPFKTFFFQKLETENHLKKFLSVFGEHLIPINNILFSLKKKGHFRHLKRIPLTPTTYGQKIDPLFQ
jgi:hypothetical protein